MSLGIRPRAVISCVEYDSVRVIGPIKAYSPRIVILFSNQFEEDELSDIRKDFVNKVREEIDEEKIHVMSFSDDIHSFPACSKMIESAIFVIDSMMQRPDIFINISAGTNEFAAAATMSAMMHDNAHIFSVKDLETNIDERIIKKTCYTKGVPTGTATKVTEPDVITVYPAEPPEEYLVLALRLLDDSMSKGENLMAKNMIVRIKEMGLWLRDGDSPNDNVFYLRDFVDKWIEKGWVTKGQMRNRYNITEMGRLVLDTFYIRL